MNLRHGLSALGLLVLLGACAAPAPPPPTRISGQIEAATPLNPGPGGGSPIGAFNPRIAEFDQKAVLHWMSTGEPIQNRRYRIKLEDGRVLEGMTDADGRTEQLQSAIGFANYRLELLPDQD